MFTLNCKGKLLSLSQPIVMGIINTTPDSFYAESRYRAEDDALKHAAKMIQEGASILDIGGQSTRPGSEEVGVKEELERVLPIITAIAERFPEIVISVDTYYAEVAKQAVEAGAQMVNDISGGQLDPNMLETVGKLNVPYVCTHLRGTPQTMKENAVYDNVTREVLDYFIERIEACQSAGIHDVIVDIGFGFSKTAAHNFTLLRNLSVFRHLDRPILLGVSRKSTICRTLDITAQEALNGTTVLHTIGLQNHANILRVHDVKEAIEAIKLVHAVKMAGE